MTEFEWLTTDDPQAMTEHIVRHVGSGFDRMRLRGMSAEEVREVFGNPFHSFYRDKDGLWIEGQSTRYSGTWIACPFR